MRTLHVTVVERGFPIERRFTSFPISVGRDASNHLALDSARVSRFHAELDVEGHEIVVRDLNATNGTVVLEGEVSTKLRGDGYRRAQEVEFLVEGFHIRARLDETRIPELTPEFLGSAWEVANRLLATSTRRPSSAIAEEHFEYVRRSIEETIQQHAGMRASLNGAAQGPHSDMADAIAAWLSALLTSLRALQNSVYVLRREGLAADETSQFLDTSIERMSISLAQGEETLSDAVGDEYTLTPKQAQVSGC